MTAETVFNVFEALPELEKQRLLKMISVKPIEPKTTTKKPPIITDSEARDIIYKVFSKACKRRKLKQIKL